MIENTIKVEIKTSTGGVCLECKGEHVEKIKIDGKVALLDIAAATGGAKAALFHYTRFFSGTEGCQYE